LPDIDRILNAAGVSLAEVDLFAVAAGPGSFTGLRIGLASIKALSQTLGRPCFGIPTLQAIAHTAGPSRATVALLPAGRGEVFAQLFSVSSQGVVVEQDAPAHLPPQLMLEKYGALRDLKWAGQGAHAQRKAIEEYAHRKGIEFGESPENLTAWILVATQPDLANDIAQLAWQRFQTGQIESAESLQAIYVRPSDAELKKIVSN
jgi:tRNA threonylcarbamoyladenosine biosynthesis protein TsaB